MLLAAVGATFVGSATNGVNGDFTATMLPGGVGVGFTGQAIEWPDGRPLQRVGIQPDVPAEPTAEGLRAGRDEVLATAVAWLRASGAVRRPVHAG